MGDPIEEEGEHGGQQRSSEHCTQAGQSPPRQPSLSRPKHTHQSPPPPPSMCLYPSTQPLTAPSLALPPFLSLSVVHLTFCPHPQPPSCHISPTVMWSSCAMLENALQASLWLGRPSTAHCRACRPHCGSAHGYPEPLHNMDDVIIM